MKPAALVFDAYGTLFDVHAVVARCESFWPGHGTQLSQLWRTKQLEWTWQRSLMRRYVPFSQVTRDALGYACESLGLPCGDAQVEALMQEYLRLAGYPDVPDALEPLVAHRGLKARFAAVLSVDSLAVYKPAPEVYGLAASRLGLRATEIGFVSSNCWDALGAKSFGFSVWWINRGSAPLDRLGFTPEGTLRGLGDLPEALAA